MSDDQLTTLIGVAAVLWRGDEVLLGERLSFDHTNVWQFPGGHLEDGESVIDCALRELEEETGLRADEPREVGSTERSFEIAGKRYITRYVSMQWQSGEARRLEPEKCAGWMWFRYDRLPSPLFEPISLFLKQHKDLKSACSGPDTPSDEQR